MTINILSEKGERKKLLLIQKGETQDKNGACLVCGYNPTKIQTYEYESGNNDKKWQCGLCGRHFYDSLEKPKKKCYKYHEMHNYENENFLKTEGIDLKGCQEYSKYGLISIYSQEDILLEQNPLCIKKEFLDSKSKKSTYYINPDENIEPLMPILKQAMENKEIKNLAIRPEEYVSISMSMRNILCEAKEWGQHFNPENLQGSTEEIIIISKFYDDKYYNDSLWVTINPKKQEITFEEIVSSNEIFSIFCVTQVIHLEYFPEEQDYYIQHLDHEFISYANKEEFEARKQQKRKGKKVKTIKIDASRIPFVKDKKIQPFLIYFLKHFFQKTDLIMEYFNSLKDT